MAQYGVLIGIGLIVAVLATGFALGAKAAAHVKQFRQEHHDQFLGRKGP